MFIFHIALVGEALGFCPYTYAKKLCAEVEIKLHTLIFVMFIPRLVNDVKILTVPINEQFYYYVFHF